VSGRRPREPPQAHVFEEVGLVVLGGKPGGFVERADRVDVASNDIGNPRAPRAPEVETKVAVVSRAHRSPPSTMRARRRAGTRFERRTTEVQEREAGMHRYRGFTIGRILCTSANESGDGRRA
jgi:hypothetical protein